MPETFSSEIRDVHERRSDKSFSSEFRGASDSLIEDHRPERAIDAHRRGRRWVIGLVLGATVLGVGGWALWNWSEPIGLWIASWKTGNTWVAAVEPTAEPEPEPELAPEPAPTPEPPVDALPEGHLDEALAPNPKTDLKPPGDAVVWGEDELPVQPIDPGASVAASVGIESTSIRGKVSSGTVGTRLQAVDTALKGCWTTAASEPATTRPAKVSVRFTIHWNGKIQSITVDGDAPEPVQQCVREALPTSGWPKPSDGGEAKVSRTWKLD